MAVPKKKTSHQKQQSRRANWKATTTQVAKCPNCGFPVRPHRACIDCGYYRGRPARRRDSVVVD